MKALPDRNHLVSRVHPSGLLSQEATVFNQNGGVKEIQETGLLLKREVEGTSRGPAGNQTQMSARSRRSRRAWERIAQDAEMHIIFATFEFIKGRFAQPGKNWVMK